MVTLDDLVLREAEIEDAKAQLFLQLKELDDSLAHVRVQMAEIRDINRDAITNNLPAETLAAIFEAGALTPHPYSISWVDPFCKYRIRTKPFEILVSSISRRWRNVALQAPRLWTDLRINISNSIAGDMLDLYISRSKLCLIDIAFTQPSKRSGSPDPNFDSKNFGWCLGQLVPHVARWRQFVVEDVHVEQLSTILSPLADLYAPTLKRVVIDHWCIPSAVVEVFSLGAPLLSHMELMGLYFVPPPKVVTSLTFGTSNQLNPSDFSRLMLRMESLTHLSITANIVAGTATTTHHPPIKIPSVLSLKLNIEMAPPTPDALYLLDLPALEFLTIHGGMPDIIVVFSHRRPYFAVHTLKLILKYPDHRGVAATTIQHFIRLIPNVRDVAFHGAHPTPILDALCGVQAVDKLLWPHLSVVTLMSNPAKTAPPNDPIFTAITDVVENRATLGRPISRITLSSRIVQWVCQKQQERLSSVPDLEVCHAKWLRFST